MNEQWKKLLALLLSLALVLGLLPTLAAAAPVAEPEAEKPDSVYVYTEEDNARIENDVFAQIDSVKAETAKTLGGLEKMTEQDYIDLLPQVIRKIESSETYLPGTLQRNGNFVGWESTVGVPWWY